MEPTRTGNEAEPDEELVRAARGGDVRAFERLLRRHEGRVLRTLRLIGVRAEDREDVAQEVFLRVFRHLERFRPGHTFSGWIYRIAVNAGHDHGRRQRRRREAPAASGEVEARADAGPGPAERADRADRRLRLERALSSLSERERVVFVLREMEGLAGSEVARALSISSVTVRRHLGRARRRLRKILDEEDEKSCPELNDPRSEGVVTR